MENELLTNAGVSHSPEIASPYYSSAILNCDSVESQPADPSLSRNLSRDCLFWERSTEQSIFDSALVSSLTPSNSNFSGGDNFVFRELIGKLGNVGEICGNVSGDQGFAERAARFSCFGSRSFNGGTISPFPINNGPVTTNEKLSRVSSSPALKPLACLEQPSSADPSAGESSGEVSRKRKAKSKQNSPSTASPSKEMEEKEDSDPKRSKKSDEKTKAIDPYKDYIHVRARRGQATDSHSLAERVRREKISERMKLLQDLVPGCNKVTGKALMLDEIINYVQSLQRQVEFLSMKLSSVTTRLDFDMDALQLQSSAETLLGDHHNKYLQLNPHISSNNIMNPSETSEPSGSFSHLPTLAHFTDSISQYSTFSEDDLHSIINMRFAQNRSHGLNQTNYYRT